MSKFDHLKNLVVNDLKTVKSTTTRIKERNPKGLAVRLYANGEVYPSEELVNHFDLNYYQKGSQSGAGFDVIDSVTWEPVASQPRMILFGVVSKTAPKVDLFFRTRYAEDGSPLTSVLNQGTPSAKLLQLAIEMEYLKPGMKFVDLYILTTYPITTGNGIALIPKSVERGEEKGKPTYERREDSVFYPVDNTAPEEVTENIEQEQTVETNN